MLLHEVVGVKAEVARQEIAVQQGVEAERQRKLAEDAAKAERQAREAESAQRRRAEENVKLAMALLDEIIVKEAKQRLAPYRTDLAGGLAKPPEREEVERKRIEKGLEFYEQLAQRNATDWTSQRARAKAYANVGLLRLNLKDFTESEKAYRRAVSLLNELALQKPGDFENRWTSRRPRSPSRVARN